MKTKFWEFNQNNSAGYFIIDDKHGVCESVIIEATTAEQAYDRLYEIGDNVNGFFDYCECCGERWYPVNECDGKNVPMHYDTPVEDVKKGLFLKRTFIHYLDSIVKEFIFKD